MDELTINEFDNVKDYHFFTENQKHLLLSYFFTTVENFRGGTSECDVTFFHTSLWLYTF